jgi:hypothetical protein
VDLDRIVPGVVGSVVGVVGWLLIGLYMQRRTAARESRNAARAVYFELDINRLQLEVAHEHGSFVPLTRSSFDRLLPELAAWLTLDDLRSIVAAYLGHAGYAQAAAAQELPAGGRAQILDALLAAHQAALEVLAARIFSTREAQTLAAARSTPPSTAAQRATR